MLLFNIDTPLSLLKCVVRFLSHKGLPAVLNGQRKRIVGNFKQQPTIISKDNRFNVLIWVRTLRIFLPKTQLFTSSFNYS